MGIGAHCVGQCSLEGGQSDGCSNTRSVTRAVEKSPQEGHPKLPVPIVVIFALVESMWPSTTWF